MNVLKATHHLEAFASKYVDCLFRGSFCEGMCKCLVLDVLRPWRRQERDAQTGDGVGTGFLELTLFGFLEGPFQKPLSWPHPFIIP